LLLLLRSLRVVVVAVSCAAIALLLAADSAPPFTKVQVSRTRRLILLLCSKSHVFLWCISSVMMLYSRRFYYVVRRRHVRCIGNGLLLPCLHSSSFFSVSIRRPFLVFVTAFLLIFCFEFPSVSACVLGFSFVFFYFCFFLGIEISLRHLQSHSVGPQSFVPAFVYFGLFLLPTLWQYLD
jgi:hypothetical protein